MTIQELLIFFTSKYPQLVRDMKNSDHGNKNGLNDFHQEGDVFTHTMMVLSETKNALDIFKYAAIMHDLGKPYTREVEEHKTRFFNHDPISGFISLRIMEDLNLDHFTRKKLFQLICLHTDAFRLTKQQQAEKYHDYGLQKLVLEFGNYDSRGRISIDNREDQDTNPLAYKPHIQPNKGKIVTILVGLPNSGKSTYREQLEASEEVFVVSRDDIIEEIGTGKNYNEKYASVDQKEVDKLLEIRFREAKNQNNVIVDLTHMSTKSRRKSLQWFKDHDKYCKVFLPPLDVITNRNDNRTGKIISNDILWNMMIRFSLPLEGEGFKEIDYIF